MFALKDDAEDPRYARSQSRDVPPPASLPAGQVIQELIRLAAKAGRRWNVKGDCWALQMETELWDLVHRFSCIGFGS